MRKIIIFISLLCFFCIGCTKSKEKVEVRIMTPEQGYSIINNNEYHLIDVRRAYEFEQGHIKNSELIPVSDIDTILDKYPNRNTKLVLYCRTGNRSNQAAIRLLELGYTEIYDLDGIESWPYDIE